MISSRATSAWRPGEKTKKQFFADDRVFWIVQSGRMRVSIDGQEPFVATKGFMVQVPYRVPYSIETEGSEASLRFEVIGAQAIPLYPLDETPAPIEGKQVYEGELHRPRRLRRDQQALPRFRQGCESTPTGAAVLSSRTTKLSRT